MARGDGERSLTLRSGNCVLLAVLLLLAVAIRPAHAEDAIGGDMVVTRGMKPWEGCGECHDLDGVAPNGHFPNLAAQKPSYIRRQMEAFRDEKRSNDHGQMGTSARQVAGPALEQVVAYFTGLEPPPPVAPRDIAPATLARARLLFEHGSRSEKIPACTNCHSPAPKRRFDAPWLEAQQPGYIAKQLEDFRIGKRANDPQGVMQKIARALPEGDVTALAAYVASLPRPRPVGGESRP